MGGTIRMWLAVLALTLLTGAPAGAQEGGPKELPSPEEQARENEKIMKETIYLYSAMSEFVGDERLSMADAKRVIAHYPSFVEIYRKGEESLEARVRKRYEKRGSYDFSLVVEAPEFQRWASERKLDGKAWFQSALRVTLLNVRAGLSEGLSEYREKIEMLEKMAGEGDPYRDPAIAEMKWILELSEKTIAVIPAPTKEEREVLEKHGKALETAMAAPAPSDEEDGPGEEEEGDSGGKER